MEVGRGAWRGISYGEGADADESLTGWEGGGGEVGEEVEVQIGVGTTTEGGLHLTVVGLEASGPFIVYDSLGGDTREGDSVRVVGGV